MKRLLAAILLIPSLCFGQGVEPEANHLWEAAALGDIPGLTYVKVTGTNPALTTTFEPLWGESAAYVPLTAVMSTPYCASSSANDTSAGTGARTISVTGVTYTTAAPFVRFTETVTMNGQTSVNLATTNVLFIDKITVLTAGSGLVNQGIVQCGTGANTGGDPSVTHAYLGVSSDTAVPAAGAGFGNVSEMFFYGVPANNTLICRNLTMSSYLATTVIGIQAVVDGFTNATGVMKRYAFLKGNNAGGNGVVEPGLIVFPEKTLIVGKMAATSATVGSLSMECLLVDNTWEDTAQRIF